MESLHELEITILLFLQSIGDWLASPLQTISLLGSEEFYMLFMPALYWCLDAALGIRMAALLILSNGLNAFLKLAFHLPRPYWIDTRMLPLSSETSFGMPSGHAMNAASLWGLLVYWMKKPWVKIAGVALIVLIGFSRLYLGMHFISDVVVGWLLGGLLLWVFLRVQDSLVPWVQAFDLKGQLALAFASSLLILLVIVISRAALGPWALPDVWQNNALRQQGGEAINPLSIDTAFTLAGTWFGMLAGAAWYQLRRGSYQTAGTLAQRILRYPIGLIGILIFWFALGKILPRDADLLSYLLRYLRYILVGVWITALAPLIFARVNLMQSPKPQKSSVFVQENPL